MVRKKRAKEKRVKHESKKREEISKLSMGQGVRHQKLGRGKKEKRNRKIFRECPETDKKNQKGEGRRLQTRETDFKKSRTRERGPLGLSDRVQERGEKKDNVAGAGPGAPKGPIQPQERLVWMKTTPHIYLVIPKKNKKIGKEKRSAA